MTEETFSELEGMTIETSTIEKQRGKKLEPPPKTTNPEYPKGIRYL